MNSNGPKQKQVVHTHIENRSTSCRGRLRAVSLFSWSVEQIARDTQLTTRVTEGARRERPPSFLASRGFAAQRSRARALLLLNLKKKRDCSQSNVGAVDREGLVHLIPVLPPEYLLPSQSSQRVLPLRYLLTLHRNVAQLRPVTDIAPKSPVLCEQKPYPVWLSCRR